MVGTLASVRMAEVLRAETAIRYAALADTIKHSRALIRALRPLEIRGASDLPAGKARQRGPRCPICSEMITDGEVVIFDRGDLIHVDCHHERPLPRLPLRSAAASSSQHERTALRQYDPGRAPARRPVLLVPKKQSRKTKSAIEQLVFPFALRVGDVVIEDEGRYEIVGPPANLRGEKLVRALVRPLDGGVNRGGTWDARR